MLSMWLVQIIEYLFNLLPFTVNDRIIGIVKYFVTECVSIFLLLIVLIFLMSFIQSFFSAEKTKQILLKVNGPVANLMAALLGTVTPFCACSSIPLFIGFTSAGLPIGVTFSFLISSPLVDLSTIFILAKFFGWKISIAYTIVGVILATVGGTIIQKMHMESYIEDYVYSIKPSYIPVQENNSFKTRIKYSWNQVVFIFKKVLPYVLVGVGLGAIIHNWIPREWIVSVLGTDNSFGVLIASIVGAPVYADIFGVIPVARELLLKGASIGVVMSFMMSVTTLSIPSLLLLRQAIKPKLILWFVTICVIGIIIIGYVFNLTQFWFV